MRNFLRWLWHAASNAVRAWQLWTWLAPTGAISAMTAYMAAQMSGIAGYQIVLFGLGAFCLVSLGWAGVFHALLRQNEWRHRTRIEGNFDYIGPHFAVEVHWNDNGKPEFINKMNIGLQIRNRAYETIQYKVTTFHATVEGRAPNTDRYVGKTMNSTSQSLSASHPDAISLGDLRKLDVKGTIEFELIYGSKNKLQYSIKKNQEFDIAVHPENSIKPKPSVGVAVRDKN